jgi:hypothetical protein
MRRLVVVLAAVAMLGTVSSAAPAGAQEMSGNVQRVATIPELKSAIAIAFIGDVMFVSTAAGVFSYDVADPAAPKRLGALPMYIWENEDMDVDVARKRIFISRDPRGFTTPATPGALFPKGAVHIIDVADPRVMKQVGFFLSDAGHTTSCVNACDVLWTAGPYANEHTQPDYVGRPIYATDVTDPAKPKPCPDPIDLNRNDGVTDYVHDVQVDSRGVAWVSGAGGVRGYHTRGRHLNPLTGHVQEATGCAPVPYAGSGTPDTATPSRFMHNAFRVPGKARDRKPLRTRSSAVSTWAAKKSRCAKKKTKRARRRCRAAERRKATPPPKKTRPGQSGGSTGKPKPDPDKPKPKPDKPKPKPKPDKPKPDKPKPEEPKPDKPKPDKPKPPEPEPEFTLAERTLMGTEENVVSDCATAGRFVTYDLEGTFDGEGFRNIASTKHRMKVFDTWTPERQEGSDGCASAHYFATRGDGITANAFYEQGVRFLDVSDPRDIRQVGWYRPGDANVFAPYWHKGYVFVADFTRGVDILTFSGSKRSKTRRAPVVTAPKRDGLRFDRHVLGGLCPLPDVPAGEPVPALPL